MYEGINNYVGFERDFGNSVGNLVRLILYHSYSSLNIVQ